MTRRLLADKVQTSTKNLAGIISSAFPITKIGFIIIALISSIYSNAQQNSNEQEQYIKVITERSAKIVSTLSITDSVKYKKVLSQLVNQYSQINNIHGQFKTATEEIKKQSLTAEERSAQIKKEEEKKYSQLLQLHSSFIAHIRENLSEEQIELVKDGMTYRIFPITYAAYQDMILTLTAEQKTKIYAWLKEARELAMDEGSSDQKHAVFGKYKGRINNYLSAAGYDMKKEGEEWQKRLKEKKESSK